MPLQRLLCTRLQSRSHTVLGQPCVPDVRALTPGDRPGPDVIRPAIAFLVLRLGCCLCNLLCLKLGHSWHRQAVPWPLALQHTVLPRGSLACWGACRQRLLSLPVAGVLLGQHRSRSGLQDLSGIAELATIVQVLPPLVGPATAGMSVQLSAILALC